MKSQKANSKSKNKERAIDSDAENFTDLLNIVNIDKEDSIIKKSGQAKLVESDLESNKTTKKPSYLATVA